MKKRILGMFIAFTMILLAIPTGASPEMFGVESVNETGQHETKHMNQHSIQSNGYESYNSDELGKLYQKLSDIKLKSDGITDIIEVEKSESIATLLNEYRESNNAEKPALKSEPMSLMAMEASTYASVSYYPGTTIPTYTSITGWPLQESYTSNNGPVLYSYYYYLDDHIAYIDYLMDYCGWLYYDDTESSDGSYATIYLVKGTDMMAIVADFEYNETVVMVTPTLNISATSISLDISSRTMIVGNQYTLEATIYPSNTTNQSVTWSSSNSRVASVSSEGIVTAKAAGSATITAKTSNGKKATCSITVKKLVLAYYPNTQIPTYTSITGKSVYNSTEFDGSMVYSYDLDIESHTDYEAYLVNKDGWTILGEEAASDYSYFSALYGKGDVTVFVIADFEQGLTGIVFDAPVTSVAVTDVTLNNTSSQMTIGDTMTLIATITPTNATNKNVTWSSSDSNIASVSSSGVVTANAAGTATITATTADGNKTSACTIIVNKPVTYTITFDANSGVGAPNAQTKVSNSMLTLTTTTPTREGFVFKGWATTKTATEPEYKPGDSFGINKDTTLYAVWISDISLDGIVGTEDVSLLAGYLIGNTSLSSKQIEAADVYGNDGLISIKDLIALAQLISAQKA